MFINIHSEISIPELHDHHFVFGPGTGLAKSIYQAMQACNGRLMLLTGKPHSGKTGVGRTLSSIVPNTQYLDFCNTRKTYPLVDAAYSHATTIILDEPPIALKGALEIVLRKLIARKINVLVISRTSHIISRDMANHCMQFKTSD